MNLYGVAEVCGWSYYYYGYIYANSKAEVVQITGAKRKNIREVKNGEFGFETLHKITKAKPQTLLVRDARRPDIYFEELWKIDLPAELAGNMGYYRRNVVELNRWKRGETKVEPTSAERAIEELGDDILRIKDELKNRGYVADECDVRALLNHAVGDEGTLWFLDECVEDYKNLGLEVNWSECYYSKIDDLLTMGR